MTLEENKIPTWFWLIAAIMLIWNAMGIFAFISQMSMTQEAIDALPTAERELHAKYPMWTKIAFAIAVFGGLLGCIALLLKKKIAKPIFIISFVGIVIQMFHSLLIAKATDVYGPGAAAMPAMLIVLGAFLIWFSNHGIKKNWLS